MKQIYDKQVNIETSKELEEKEDYYCCFHE